MVHHNYFVYVITNPAKTVLYIGVTNNLQIRLQQHFDTRGDDKTFAGKYNCFNLLYYERHQYINNAIAREKELKNGAGLKRKT